MEARMIDCSVCGGDVSAAGDVIVSELIECGECGTEYEVTNVVPLSVVEAPMEEEDWGE
jgi:alpha-aminoadipate carrier protein LysW